MSDNRSDEDAGMADLDSINSNSLAFDGPAETDIQTGEAESDLQDDASWAEGDFELTSSDNVRFKVDAVHLCSAR